jgi:aspartate racemase
MEMLGIIGGIGPESTIEYYRRINALYRERIRDGSAPSIIINSIDMKKLLGLVEANELDELTGYLTAEVEKLARGGATFALLAANTPHLVFDAVARQSTIPLISIVEAHVRSSESRRSKASGIVRDAIHDAIILLLGRVVRPADRNGRAQRGRASLRSREVHAGAGEGNSSA